MKKTNPFKFGSVVSGDYFYNRTEELQRIKQTLAGGNNITLYAPRRYGKSSLVKKALVELEKQGFITIYVDFMSVYSQETFIKNYSKAIAEGEKQSLEATVKKIAKLITGIVPSVSFDSAGLPTFSFSWIQGSNKEQTLIDVINLPQQLASDKSKWIIAFDEFQEVTKLNGERFEKILRSCIQHHNNVSYLFLGSKTHLLQDMFNNRNRAFYNSASIMGIGKISEEKSIEFLTSRFRDTGVSIDKKIAIYLLRSVDNIPYYIQFIAFEIWQSAQLNNINVVSTTDIDKALETIIQLKSDYYWEMINKQTSYRKKVLYVLSCGVQEIFSKETTNNYDLGSVSTTQKALDVFIEDGLVEKMDKHYILSDPLFKLFINNNL